MPKRNPVLSMSGNMWERLTKYRSGALSRLARNKDRTDAALFDRKLIHVRAGNGFAAKFEITDLGRMVADAYHEGQESKA